MLFVLERVMRIRAITFAKVLGFYFRIIKQDPNYTFSSSAASLVVLLQFSKNSSNNSLNSLIDHPGIIDDLLGIDEVATSRTTQQHYVTLPIVLFVALCKLVHSLFNVPQLDFTAPHIVLTQILIQIL